jgi:hypothetical protein
MKEQVSDKAAIRIAKFISKLQWCFAASMHKFSASWQRKHQLVFIVAVSIIFISLSVGAIINPFTKDVTKVDAGKIIIPSQMQTEITMRITKEEFTKVQKLKLSLDSETMRLRPGLVDSIRMVEELYYSQDK